MRHCFIRRANADSIVPDKVWHRVNESMHLGMLDGKLD